LKANDIPIYIKQQGREHIHIIFLEVQRYEINLSYDEGEERLMLN